MADLQERYFAALSESRSKDADALDRPNLRGVKKSIVDKYSDQAHFVYELIQNADDAKATEATFCVYHDKLIFKHNGTRLFDVTNPETEDEDSVNHSLGDVNAITGIGLSSKLDSNKKGNAIGKFGMGFKSIFQYTASPEIYDPNIAFRIERQIVPVRINNDCPGRAPNETLFVFPFNNSEAKHPAEDSFSKLKSLLFPTLFLNNLKVIRFGDGMEAGEYRKDVLETFAFGEGNASAVCERIEYTRVIQSEKSTERLILFSRTDADNHRYAIGFRLDAEGRLTASDYKAFCFFPTQHETKLKFLVHAPFLLTDSRETIKVFEDHNKDMVDKLSTLVCDSLLCMRDMRTQNGMRLIDDGILDVLPLGLTSSEFFAPFWEKVASCFSQECILPSADGYVAKSAAYWPVTQKVPLVFSDEKLQTLYDDQDLRWVFRSRWNGVGVDKDVSSFIWNCIEASPSEVALLDRITPSFIEAQPTSWLFEFYTWLSESRERYDKARCLPIFLNRLHKAVAAFDQKKQHCLFLPAQGSDSYETISEDIVSEKATRELIKLYEIKEPSRADRVYYIISNRLPSCSGEETVTLFKEVVEYYAVLPVEEKDRLVEEMCGEKILLASIDLKTGEKSSRHLSEVYSPSDFIREYFAGMDNVAVVDLESYRHVIDQSKWRDLSELLSRLTEPMPVIMTRQLTYEEWSQLRDRFQRLGTSFAWPADKHLFEQKFTVRYVHGASTFLRRILDARNLDEKKKLSLMLWDVVRHHADEFKKRHPDADKSFCMEVLGKLLDRYVGKGNSNCLYEETDYKQTSLRQRGCNCLSGLHEYLYYGTRFEGFDSPQLLELRAAEWIALDDLEYASPNELSLNRLPGEYRIEGDDDPVVRMLAIGPREVPKEKESAIVARAEAEAKERLSEGQKATLELGEAAERLGLTAEDLKAYARQKEAQKRAESEALSEYAAHDGLGGEAQSRTGDGASDASEIVRNVHAGERGRIKEHSVLRRIEKEVMEYRIQNQKHAPPPLPSIDEEFEDDDEQTPKVVNFGERIKRREQKQAAEIAELERGDELQRLAQEKARYSFGWFKALLELEMLGKEGDEENQREISICFTKMEREFGTERTFVLKRPNRNIPAWVEELSGIPLHMIVGKRQMQAVVEVMSVRSFTLRVKLKASSSLDQLNCEELVEAKIQAQRPTFLLNELKRSFESLTYDEDKNLKDDLTKDIEFVFGPPGTGKTTFLAMRRIIPLMQRDKDCRVLVLAPTNKAADVLTARIVANVENGSYQSWLIRFGITADESLERTGVCLGKDVDLKKYPRHTVITTIARFPYDKFITGNSEPVPLAEQEWDYIIIDEASMIPLVNIIYPLYKKTDARFIIAGDPHQIEPIISCDLWKDENIYTMVGLDDFASPRTEPREYRVVRLTTQYRSVPPVGKVFSAYGYKGILQHSRESANVRPLEVVGLPELRSLTKISFPVSPYESIYRLKRLGKNGGSSYQIYSALFAFEFVCAIAKRMKCQSEKFRIGVISPYRAQADLVQKLVESETFPDYIDISAGTVHGFQGDECEMIVALFNPPPGISGRAGSFINKKNIVNVAVSRARDYLVVVMPDDATPNVGNMHEVRRVEAIMRHDPENFIQHTTAEFERAIFGDDKFIEKNAFSTGHQTVNVYGLPDARYEVRSEDAAVDIQIRKTVDSTPLY